MEQRNYSHGKFSPFDNLPYRLAPPQPPSLHAYTPTNTKCSVIYTVKTYAQQDKENAGLCLNPRGNICCQASSFQ